MVDLTKFYTDLATEIHAHNVRVGWWDDPDECLFQKLQLVSTEVAEATEGARKNIMDTHLVNRKMEEVEYADAMIRMLDLGGRLKLDYISDEAAHHLCIPTNSVGCQHLGINAAIVGMAVSLRSYQYASDRRILKQIVNEDYSEVINSIVKVASNRNCSLFTAIEAKREYNAQRADHKRENREKADGKKF